MEYARHEALMASSVNAGGTQRAHLKKLARQQTAEGAKARAALQPPVFPSSVGYLWAWFCELDGLRRAGATGAEPLAAVDIDAWARLMDVRPEPREVRTLVALDRVWRNPGAGQTDG